MAHSKLSSFSLNPSWPHYLAYAATVIALLIGLARYIALDGLDPLKCGVLMTRGSWLDSAFSNWQPDGCMLHKYQASDAATCLGNKRVIFIGDSVTRKLFFQAAHILDSSLPIAPVGDDHKHEDHTFYSKSATQLSFYWDPYLNASRTRDTLARAVNSKKSSRTDDNDTALLVLGSGLWYLRYASSSGGLPAWEANTESLMKIITGSHVKRTRDIVMLPVEEVVSGKLSQERAQTMHESDIDAMNSDLLHRINPSSGEYLHLFRRPPDPVPVLLPLVFNKVLDPTQTDDGLHFSDAVMRTQANILLNLRCNDVLPKKFPLDKTCCRSYPHPIALHLIVLALVVLWGPYIWIAPRYIGHKTIGLSHAEELRTPALVISMAAGIIYLADRTGFWLKEQKQFEPLQYTLLHLMALAGGLSTMKRADKDLGFLNREQTDEWKGWMQLAILIYHYLGASKISGIYNPIRVLVAAYLFMTGYGHTTFYLRKADFGFLRIAQVMVRLNLLTLMLAYTMNTDYISYYFAPLVSLWFLIIYATMVAGARFNENTVFLVSKIVMSAGVVTTFMHAGWPLEMLFDFLGRVCGIHWSAREWTFRVTLDMWIVYVGMLSAIAVIKIHEHRLTDHPLWHQCVKASVIGSGLVMIWFFAFELMQESKFTYNKWHPYVSALPVLAFAVLRNATPVLRSASSTAFAFIGTCSLETFIIQYHLWLAGDTKGVLLVVPGTKWRPINFVITTIMFIYISHRVAQATGELTKWICGTSSKSLPLPVITAPAPAIPMSSYPPLHPPQSYDETLHPDDGQDVPLISPDIDSIRKDREGNILPPEPDTPIRPGHSRRWVDRLASPARQSPLPGFRIWYGEGEWNPGVKTKLTIGFGFMWIVNILWTYPS